MLQVLLPLTMHSSASTIGGNFGGSTILKDQHTVFGAFLDQLYQLDTPEAGLMLPMVGKPHLY